MNDLGGNFVSQIYRYEEKYLINYRQYEIIKKRIEKLFSVDKFADQDHEYLITSIYFDDYMKKSVNDNLQGLKERYKYRIRLYNLNTHMIKLEKKIKDNEQGYKQSITLSLDEYQELIDGKFNLLEKRDEALARELVYSMKVRLLKPIIKIEYHRYPFVLPFNDIRVTFDRDITYSTKNFNDQEPLTNQSVIDMIVLEIKYNHFFPNYLKKLFQIDSVTKLSISKYLICYLHSIGEDIQI
ncbi:MAG: polyphosphate polymerase protein [Haloplasmataceae bacterium]|jgi:hypothetical protein|nr:polyphosphate polymerase protein [Haloplasmataceae bacterium]